MANVKSVVCSRKCKIQLAEWNVDQMNVQAHKFYCLMAPVCNVCHIIEPVKMVSNAYKNNVTQGRNCWLMEHANYVQDLLRSKIMGKNVRQKFVIPIKNYYLMVVVNIVHNLQNLHKVVEIVWQINVIKEKS